MNKKNKIRTAKILGVFLLVLLGGFKAFAQSQATVKLKGVLKNFGSQVEIYDGTDFQYLLPPDPERIIIPDENGNFEWTFSIEKPKYFLLGRNTLYLSPGDDLEVFIDRNNPTHATFVGKGSNACLYLRNNPFPKAGSYLEAGRVLKPIAAEHLANLEKIATQKKKELQKVKRVSSRFKKLEYARIQSDLINSIRSSMGSYKPRTSADSLQKFNEEMAILSKPLLEKYSKGLIDSNYMDLVVYRDIASQIIKYDSLNHSVPLIKDWYLATLLINSMKKEKEKSNLKHYIEKIEGVQTIRYRNALYTFLENMMRFGKGDIAKDFEAVDLQGNTVALSSLKGKVIYIDVWAIWCGPCMEEMPHLEKLKEKYKEDSRVAIVSLSIDDIPESWKENVRKRNAGGIQWNLQRSLLHAYNVAAIPRAFLIDKNFVIQDFNAPVPSAPQLINQIDELLIEP